MQSVINTLLLNRSRTIKEDEMTDSHLLRKEQCPQCAAKGKDKSHDNLAIYSDGHSFCFSCYYNHFSDKNKISGFTHKGQTTKEQEKKLVYLPPDCDVDYPLRCITWMEKYGLSVNDLLFHNALWSEGMQRLIFPLYSNSEIIAWQGRSFSLGTAALTHKKIPKWFGEGKLDEIFNVLGKGKTVVLVEDIISAIKVSKFTTCIPLYGSEVSRKRFERLNMLFGRDTKVLIWLDPDKRKESIKFVKRGQLWGLDCHSVITDQDPKECSYEEIEEIVQYE